MTIRVFQCNHCRQKFLVNSHLKDMVEYCPFCGRYRGAREENKCDDDECKDDEYKRD